MRIRIHTECPVRHTKCGRMRGMVVGEGGRSSGVLLYLYVEISWNGARRNSDFRIHSVAKIGV